MSSQSDKLQKVVIGTIKTQTDSIDWQKALILVDYLNRHPDNCSVAFSTIRQLATQGNRQDKLNCIALIDSLFKNGNPKLLKQLQTSRSILGISGPEVVSDPHVHRLLCKTVESWMEVCRQSRVLVQSFVDWITQLFSFRYRYVMTQKVADKFSNDFSAALELLGMFSQALATALLDNTGPDDDMVQEMLPNVNEIHQRLKDLKPTMPDPYVRSVIDYLEDYCDLCKQCYRTYIETGTVNIDALTEMAARGIPQQAPVMPPPLAMIAPPPMQMQPPPMQMQPPPMQMQMQPPPMQMPPMADPADDLIQLDSLPVAPEPVPMYPAPPVQQYPAPQAFPFPAPTTAPLVYPNPFDAAPVYPFGDKPMYPAPERVSEEPMFAPPPMPVPQYPNFTADDFVSVQPHMATPQPETIYSELIPGEAIPQAPKPESKPKPKQQTEKYAAFEFA